MTVKALIEKLANYNQIAEVKVVAHNTMSDFDITFGTSDNCEKETCDTFFLIHIFFRVTLIKVPNNCFNLTRGYARELSKCSVVSSRKGA